MPGEEIGLRLQPGALLSKGLGEVLEGVKAAIHNFKARKRWFPAMGIFLDLLKEQSFLGAFKQAVRLDCRGWISRAAPIGEISTADTIEVISLFVSAGVDSRSAGINSRDHH